MKHKKDKLPQTALYEHRSTCGLGVHSKYDAQEDTVAGSTGPPCNGRVVYPIVEQLKRVCCHNF